MNKKAVFILLGLLCCFEIRAYDLPPMNLGLTSFLDGTSLPPHYGFYWIQYAEQYHTDEFTNAKGQKLAGVSSPDFDPMYTLTQLTYVSQGRYLLGAHSVSTLIIPYMMDFRLQEDNALGLSATSSGLGDLTGGIGLQWDPLMKNGRPFWVNRAEFSMNFPTGEYDVHKNINPGSNHYSFDPYWASTVFITAHWSVSTRMNFLWNQRNEDTGVKAGSAFHMNYASAYEVLDKKLYLGIAGYYLKQLKNSEGDPAADSKERVFAIGPGFLWGITQSTGVTFNAYQEMAAENRTQGQRYVLSLAHGFA